MAAIKMVKNIRTQNSNSFLEKLENKLQSQNKTDSEFILILTMWAKEKQSEFRMFKEISTCKGKFQQLPSLMGREICFLE